MGIPAEVLKDALGAMEGRFAIDDPFFKVWHLGQCRLRQEL
jgi:hypothetical protein